MKSPAELLAEMKEVLEKIQTNDAQARTAASAEGLALSAKLHALRHLGPYGTIEQYIGEYELHVERLATASRDSDGNHIDLIGAMTAIEKLRGWAGFKIE